MPEELKPCPICGEKNDLAVMYNRWNAMPCHAVLSRAGRRSAHASSCSFEWSAHPPTEPGWYWHVNVRHKNEASIVHYSATALNAIRNISGDERWAGPIPMPEETV